MTLSTTLLCTLPEALRPEEDVAEPRPGDECRGRLQSCTEGLGFESSDEAEDATALELSYQKQEAREGRERRSGKEGGGRAFPPAISSIGKSGRPCVRFERYTEGGRFVLRETWVPTQEVLQASREGGRLRLSFVQMDDDNFQEHDRDDETRRRRWYKDEAACEVMNLD